MKIVLSGTKGAGKSSVAKRLSTQLSLPAIETDTLIEDAFASLHICLYMDFATREIHRPNTPDLPCVNPRIILGRRDQFDVLTQIRDWFGRARQAHAIGGERDPVTILGFNDRMNIKVDATVGPNQKIVDAMQVPR